MEQNRNETQYISLLLLNETSVLLTFFLMNCTEIRQRYTDGTQIQIIIFIPSHGLCQKFDQCSGQHCHAKLYSLMLMFQWVFKYTQTNLDTNKCPLR